MQKLQGKESKKKQQDDDRMMMCTGLRGVWCVREWWEGCIVVAIFTTFLKKNYKGRGPFPFFGFLKSEEECVNK